MNSLEFIDKEIRRYIAIIRITSGEKKSYYKQVVKQLKQIKAEIEAWEIVKEKAEIIEVVTTFENPSYAKETTPTLGNSEPVEIRISIVGKDKIKTVKKALEVE